MTEQHGLHNGDGETAIDFGLLEGTHIALAQPIAFQTTIEWGQKTNQTLEQSTLAGPIGLDHAVREPAENLPVR